MSTPDATRYEQARRWLAARPDFESASPEQQRTTHFPLGRPARLLAKLGWPDERFRIVLIAGTKGKGSTAALCASILQAHGQRVGLYSQPHLHTFRERLRIDGELIGEAEFADALTVLQPMIAAADAQSPRLGRLTTYEITTMMALDWFSRRGVDWAVLEVGLGGRLDATNVVRPDLAIITPISYDHTQVLGRTLGAIAAEKAGILKPGGIAVIAPQRPAAGQVIRRIARQNGASLFRCEGPRPIATPLQFPADAPTVPLDPFFQIRLQRADGHQLSVDLHLGGRHQLDNLQTALTGLDLPEIDLDLEDAAIQRGVAATRWPGRLEVVRTAPLLVLDGAHNGASAAALYEALQLHFSHRRLHLVLGVLADKDLGAILTKLRGSHKLIAVAPDSPRALPAAEIARLAQRLGIRARVGGTVAEGIKLALAEAERLDLVCVTGSLSVVAEAREALGLAPTPVDRALA